MRRCVLTVLYTCLVYVMLQRLNPVSQAGLGYSFFLSFFIGREHTFLYINANTRLGALTLGGKRKIFTHILTYLQHGDCTYRSVLEIIPLLEFCLNVLAFGFLL